jgi:hypothetical protein
MSADNYVVVKRFGDKDYRWAMGFASDEGYQELKFGVSFKTPQEAAENAQEELEYIEYGISFDKSCLRED